MALNLEKLAQKKAEIAREIRAAKRAQRSAQRAAQQREIFGMIDRALKSGATTQQVADALAQVGAQPTQQQTPQFMQEPAPLLNQIASF